jgi:THO complex subunit 2
MRTDLCESLPILLAQQKNCVIYKEATDAPVKLASQMVDQCQETYMQFVNFLRSNIKPEEYVKRIPLITPLLTDYHLPAEAAFFLSRYNYSTKSLVGINVLISYNFGV